MSKVAIVCVDDQQIILECLEGQLKHYYGEDFILKFSNSAMSALNTIEKLKQEGIDNIVVVADFNLGSIKGDEMLSIMHIKYPNIGKVLVSGCVSPEMLEALKATINLNGFVYKPWDEKDLIKAIDSAVIDVIKDQDGFEIIKKQLNSSAVLCISNNKGWEAKIKKSGMSLDGCSIYYSSDIETAEIIVESLASGGIRKLILVADWGVRQYDLIIDIKSQFTSVKFIVLDGEEKHNALSKVVSGVEMVGPLDSEACIDTAKEVINNAVYGDVVYS